MDYNSLFEVYKKRIDYIYSKSALFNKNFIHNVKQSGENIEVEVRSLFRQFLPDRYRITSGYIVHAKNHTTPVQVSPQIDMIIVDTLVPHSIFSLDEQHEVEVVPIEAVIGIFEIKRTLTKKQLASAITHLEEVSTKLDLKKTANMFLPGGVEITTGLAGGYPSNPMLGIISLENKVTLHPTKGTGIKHKGGAHIEKIREELAAQLKNAQIDIITTLGDFFCAPCKVGISHQRNQDGTVTEIRSPSFHCNTLPGENLEYYYKKANGHYEFTENFAHTLGYISGYLQNVVGRKLNPNNYFFHPCLNASALTP